MKQSNPNPSDSTTTQTKTEEVLVSSRPRVPGLLLSWAPPDLIADDRAAVSRELVIGRSSACDWCLRDDLLSREHFTVAPAGAGKLFVRDLGSRNGIYINGVRLEASQEVVPGTVLRAGNCVFVTHGDLGAIPPPASRDEEIAGPFHGVLIQHQLRVASRTDQHLLIEGESGVGKELAARAVYRYLRALGRKGSLVSHNAALFAGEDDAIGALFGVGRGAFTGVEPRRGLLEESNGGVLFLDELHALPLRAQRSLLRFVEDGIIQPLGQSSGGGRRDVDVRLICGTNISISRACDEGQLAHDLVARLHRVRIPPLRERRADVSSIFADVVRQTVGGERAQSIVEILNARVAEKLSLNDYHQGNVRELQQSATLIAARVAEGEMVDQALYETLEERLGGPQLSVTAVEAVEPEQTDESVGEKSSYEQHRLEIMDAYQKSGSNLSRMEEILRGQGFSCTRRWLAIYLDRWGVRPIPKRGG